MKKLLLWSIILPVCVLSLFVLSCGGAADTTQNTTAASDGGGDLAASGEEAVAHEEKVRDDVPEMDLGGRSFRILSSGELRAWHGVVNIEEETGDLVDDSIYRRNRVVEGRFNIVMSEVYADWGVTQLKKSVKAGSDDYDFVTGWCDPMFGLFLEGLGYRFSQYGGYIDLSKPYWDPGLTRALTFGGEILFPVGAVDVTTYDLIHVLLFNKQLLADLSLENPYSLVKNGNWTFDKYAEMAKAAVRDLDGNGVMDKNDRYGLVTMVKYALPCFWVAAGVETIAKNADGLPEFNLAKDEKFATVINRIFEMTYDNESWYKNPGARENYSELHDEIFMSGRALFFNNTFKMVEYIRGMETDFGIIPYPKFTSDQSAHYTRMEGCFPFIVPATVPEPETIGAIIEVMSCESLGYVVPAYYEVSLKNKHARDEESAAMLDVIFANRVMDLGDSIWCGILRDGIFVDMFAKNDRNLASRLEKVEKQMDKAIDKVLTALQSGG